MNKDSILTFTRQFNDLLISDESNPPDLNLKCDLLLECIQDKIVSNYILKFLDQLNTEGEKQHFLNLILQVLIKDSDWFSDISLRNDYQTIEQIQAEINQNINESLIRWYRTNKDKPIMRKVLVHALCYPTDETDNTDYSTTIKKLIVDLHQSDLFSNLEDEPKFLPVQNLANSIEKTQLVNNDLFLAVPNLYPLSLEILSRGSRPINQIINFSIYELIQLFENFNIKYKNDDLIDLISLRHHNSDLPSNLVSDSKKSLKRLRKEKKNETDKRNQGLVDQLKNIKLNSYKD